ncbi:MAG: gluconate 2-dehydrogenase subunit 3 family protein [Pseudomonadota bacterium]|nr:gluconate 2-dehydrogenase subunit 3 family protein [Pseudomonadota bacterium]
MREVDKRTRFSRRGLLRAGATALPAAAFAARTISATSAWAETAQTISPHAMATLVLLARDIYPHDHIADSFYIKAVTPWDAKAGKDAGVRDMIMGGVDRLDADANDRHKAKYLGVGWEADRVALLRAVEDTKFFRTLRADLVVSLYNQPEIWPKFGYEGSSAEYGGYINRGFNDIDWLPAA